MGAAISRDFDYGKITFSPEISAHHVRGVAGTRPTSHVTLLDGATTSSVSGASTGSNLLRADLGGSLIAHDHVDVSLFCNGEFGDSFSNNGLILEVNYFF